MSTLEAGTSPVHLARQTSARWSTVNAREAFAGVVTPLTYTFYFPGAERATARFWKDLGLLERTAADDPDNPDQRFFGVFHGRMAINVDRYGEMANRTPGTSAAALEEQMFGVARSGVGMGATRRRYPMVALTAPGTVYRARRDTLRDFAAIPQWRRTWLTRLREADPATARAAFRDARARLETVLYRHIMLTAATQGLYEAAGKLAHRAGHPGAESEIVASSSGTDEAHMIDALRKVAAGAATMDSFLADYGFHGPDEGHLNATVWRQDPAPLHALLERYRAAGERDQHGAAEARAIQRANRTTEVLIGLSPIQRPLARGVLRAAGAMPVLREQGKAQFLQVVDVGRAASMALGAHLIEAGQLDTADDVFYLTADELLTGDIDQAAISKRRGDHTEFLRTDLPIAWNGEPNPIPVRERAAPDAGRTEAGTSVTGLGVSAGTARGRVRIMHQLSDDDFDVDDILVCHTTDPSWASIMAIAAGLVIDVGGAISHGAIVARELGIPCVIATATGTQQLRDGDYVEVSGSAGTVTVLDQS